MPPNPEEWTATAEAVASAPFRPFRHRPTPAAVARHVVDAVAPPLAFVVGNAQWGARWAAIVALVVAVAIAALRRHRGEPRAVVAISTTIVAMHSASAILVGQGRAFYLPELVINLVGLAVCLGSLLVARPVTEVVCRRLRIEPATPPADRAAYLRRHRRLSVWWSVMWAAHLVPLVYLYAVDSVVGLTALSAVVNKPTLLAMAVVTVVVVRRAAARDRTAPCPRSPA